MARSRNIKPGFFKNEVLVEMPYETRLLFVGLWCLADREGRFEDRPKKIKMELFPMDNIDISSCLTDLEVGGFLLRYEFDGKRYAQIANFTKHQVPHYKEVASEIPAPLSQSSFNVKSTLNQSSVNVDLTLNQSSVNQSAPCPSDSLIPDSLNLIPDTGYLIPDCGLRIPPQAAAPASPNKSKKSPKVSLPNDFKVSDEVRAWAEKNNVQHLDRHFSSFIDKVQANGYAYANWDAALRNAISGDWAKLGSQAGRTPFAPYESAKDISRRIALEQLTGKVRNEPNQLFDLN